jgi:RNA polymerase sigma-70 factor, ECF subfamily
MDLPGSLGRYTLDPLATAPPGDGTQPLVETPASEPHFDPPPAMANALRGIRPRVRDVTRSSDIRAKALPPALQVSDDELMAQMAAGEIAALEQVYDRYSALVFSVSLRVLNDRQLAEDVVQEVFLRLWRRPSAFVPERGRFISWLMSVTRNRALDELRRRSRRQRVEERDDEPGHELPAKDATGDPQAGLVLAEQRRAVREAMTRLPPAQRRVIELAYFGGLTQVEIAEETGDPLGTVKTRIRLGMRKLREALTEMGESGREVGGDARGT